MSLNRQDRPEVPPSSGPVHVPAATMASQSDSNCANEPKARRKRLRLSCQECRKRKLFCDRNLPCQRCIKTGRGDKCSFEAGAERQQPPVDPSSIIKQGQRQGEQIQHLQAEVTELKALLAATRLTSVPTGGDAAHETASRPSAVATGGDPDIPHTGRREHIGQLDEPLSSTQVGSNGPSHPVQRSPRGYYSQHTLFRFFVEIPDLFPFMRETAAEWFQPLGIHLSGSKSAMRAQTAPTPPSESLQLDALLPPKADVDELVSFYLDHLEQTHRILHVPAFKREYTKFWAPEVTRRPTMKILILAIMSISACISAPASGALSASVRYREVPAQWIPACSEWLKQQSPKHRKLVHYQISCLVYMAKRAQMIGKKWYWKETGSMIQDAVLDGLHRNHPKSRDNPYSREMKRRIWAVLRELDIQNTIECGFPTLLYSLDSDVEPPINLNDEDFDETSSELPSAKPLHAYTSSSFQVHSARSWSLRLEISRRLYSTASSDPLSYDDVLRYTHEISQDIGETPNWEADDVEGLKNRGTPFFARAMLQFQLKDCILALHRPYLQSRDGRFWLSKTVCHQASRDILQLQMRLADLGLQSLTIFRDDLLLASLSFTSLVTMSPKCSSSGPGMADSKEIVELLQKCLPFTEERYLRGCNEEPWCFLTMCAAIMMIKIHLGQETRQTAKASCARRYLELHYQRSGGQPSPQLYQGYPTSTDATGSNVDVEIAAPSIASTRQAVTLSAPDFQGSEWLKSSSSEALTAIPEFGFDSFSIDMDVDSGWDFLNLP